MQLSLTEDQIREYIKCAKDPVYFIEHYVKIITLDKGFVQISLYPFQKQAVQDINDNRRVIVKAGRQVGKTTMVVGYILWYILFNEDKFVAILANKAPTAREILNQFSYYLTNGLNIASTEVVQCLPSTLCVTSVIINAPFDALLY